MKNMKSPVVKDLAWPRAFQLNKPQRIQSAFEKVTGMQEHYETLFGSILDFVVFLTDNFARPRMVLELRHFWGNFNLDHILTRPITLWEGIWIPYIRNLLFQCCVAAFLGQQHFQEKILWKSKIAWELSAFKVLIRTFAAEMLVGKYLQKIGHAHCQHESSTFPNMVQTRPTIGE